MNYKISLGPSFKSSLKKLKRFRHVKDDIREAIKTIQKNPALGVVVPGGHGARKLRVPNSDIPRGKSGGYRLYYLVEEQPDPVIYPIFVFSKSDQSDISARELKRLIQELQQD
jgi:mRNA-degrading endonuclease RelE of RelBE toxin-antitoxin system